MLAYLTTGGTAPWIGGGIAVGLTALILRTRRARGSEFLPLLAIIGFIVAAIAIILLAVSQACEGVGGCMH